MAMKTCIFINKIIRKIAKRFGIKLKQKSLYFLDFG